jgi:hypothetical protein
MRFIWPGLQAYDSSKIENAITDQDPGEWAFNSFSIDSG